MEYLIEDIYGVVDKMDGLNEALGYLLLDESQLPARFSGWVVDAEVDNTSD